MFNRRPKRTFGWRLHLLRDIVLPPANGATSILSSHAPCEGWASSTATPLANDSGAAAALAGEQAFLSLNARPA
jgi:hypothetical protein